MRKIILVLAIAFSLFLTKPIFSADFLEGVFWRYNLIGKDGQTIHPWELTAEQIAAIGVPSLMNEIEDFLASGALGTQRGLGYAYWGDLHRLNSGDWYAKTEIARGAYLAALAFDPNDCYLAATRLPQMCPYTDLALLENLYLEKLDNPAKTALLRSMYTQGFYDGNHDRALLYLSTLKDDNCDCDTIWMAIDNIDAAYKLTPEYKVLLQSIYNIVINNPNIEVLDEFSTIKYPTLIKRITIQKVE